ncbi:MAG: hypothetical protein M1831_003058 [Alyxoria varia]|nr:MAG: hypothetical protein M1831_003058 [Alyxoria varia]
MSTESPHQNITNPQPPPIDTLLQLLPTHTTNPSVTPSIISTLTTHPELALASDFSGYTLAHAAASYKALDILRALGTSTDGRAIINKPDADGDTPLFYAETLAAAKLLIEELGADWRADRVRNSEGKNAEQNAQENADELTGTAEEAEGWKEVAEYLKRLRQNETGTVNGDSSATAQREFQQDAPADSEEPLRHPPPLPPGVTINLMNNPPSSSQGATENPQNQNNNTTEIDESSLPPPDPEFRRRIEALAAREGGLETQEGQRELRELVEDAVGGLQDGGASGGGDGHAGSKRRTG